MIDTTLPTKLREDVTWKQTFINLLIEYFYKNIPEPNEVKAKTQTYRQDNDPNAEIVRQYIEVSHENTVLKWTTLWGFYEQWHIQTSTEKVNKKVVKKYFESKIFKKEEKKHNDTRGWKGWKLVNIEALDDDL